MELDLKTGPQGHVYFSKNLRKILGDNMKILPNTNTAAIYAAGTDPSKVIASLEVIISDLKLRVKEGEDTQNGK